MKREDVTELQESLINYISKSTSQLQFLPKLIVPSRAGFYKDEGIKKPILDGSYAIRVNSRAKETLPTLRKSKLRNTKRRFASMDFDLKN